MLAVVAVGRLVVYNEWARETYPIRDVYILKF